MSETKIRREQTPPEEPGIPGPTINRPVLIGATAVIAAVTAFCLISPSTAESSFSTTVGWATRWFGWFYIALGTVVLVFVLYLALSRYGKIRLGPEHSRPEFTTTEWAAMLFAAGIGTDLMFFAVNEPVVQFLTPPSASPESVEAAREATVWTMFHYGITGWAMYALMGMALGYFAYRLNLPWRSGRRSTRSSASGSTVPAGRWSTSPPSWAPSSESPPRSASGPSVSTSGSTCSSTSP